jgi:hypothetical protein
MAIGKLTNALEIRPGELAMLETFELVNAINALEVPPF